MNIVSILCNLLRRDVENSLVSDFPDYRILIFLSELTQPAIACLKLTIKTLEKGVKYVQSL